MEYRKFGPSYVVRLDRGEEVVESLTALCRQENIRLGSISGLGAVNDVTLGAFNHDKFLFESARYTGTLEMASCVGNISTKDGEVYLHLHATVGNPVNNECHGGHLSRAVISLTGEFILQSLEGTVEREYSPEIGLNLFRFTDAGNE